MSLEQGITELLGIQGWEVVEEGLFKEDELGEVTLSMARCADTGYCCAGCGQLFLVAYDHQEPRVVRDLDAWGRRCYLRFSPARVACPDCGVHTEALDWIESRERHTLRFERLVAILCQLMTPIDVASYLGLTKNVVYRIDRKWLSRREELRKHKPVRHLGIDEIAVRKGHRYATLFYDLERREVIGGVLSRKQRAVSGFFRRWGKEACKEVVAVCTDLWAPYHNSVKRYLKNAVLVFDKFHVYSYLSDAIDQVRRDEQNRQRGDGMQLIKGSRWLWLKHRKKLKRKQRETLDEILAANKNLQKAYLLKEDFEGFYECETREEAEVFLKQWTRRCKQSVLLPFKDLARRLSRWKEGILAYFEHRITNSIAEGLNNKVKVIKRRSYGFHDFTYFLLKIMDLTGALPPIPSLTHTYQE